MTRATPSNETTTTHSRLHLAFELSNTLWKLGFAVSRAGKLREHNVPAGDLERTLQAIEAAKQAFGLAPDALTVACYEAGRDGFWLQRELELRGVDCYVVEPASILVDRRLRHAKTDGLDLKGLMALLVRYAEGEREVWRVVKVPPRSTEDLRCLERERTTLVKERSQHAARVRSVLVRAGIKVVSVTKALESVLPTIRGRGGVTLDPFARAQISRELVRMELVNAQIKEIEAHHQGLIEERANEDPIVLTARRLSLLKGIGTTSAFVLSAEFFGWREFKNRKQVAALAGLTPTPWQSGDTARDQGISKAGNPRIRSLAIQLAWGWLRFQPESKLAKWFQERTQGGNKRLRRIAIVAVARQLLVALWRYLEHGIIPEGAVLSEACCEGVSRRGGRSRRAKRCALVTPERMPAPSVRAGRKGLAEVADSSALPPSEDGGAGRKDAVGRTSGSRRKGGSRVTASLRAGAPPASELTLGAGASVPQPARRAPGRRRGVAADCGEPGVGCARGGVSR